MNKPVSATIAGIAACASVGTAAYMATAKSSKAQRRALKKNAGKALRTVGNVIDNMSSMIG